jgi:2-dehydropantoate 2-reductase
MHVVIFGTGGVGGSFGAYLARAGVRVTFFARGAHMKAIQKDGLRVEALEGNFIIKPAQVTDNPDTIKSADIIFVCTKSWQIESIIDHLKIMIQKNTVVIPLLNSVEAADFLIEKLGSEHVLGGLCYTISYILQPGVIQSGGMSLIVLGELNQPDSERAQQLNKLLNDTPGITAENVPNIRFRMWKKFAWISCAGAVGAVTRAPSGIWRKIPETRQLFEGLLEEVFLVAQKYGARLQRSEFDEIMEHLDNTAEDFRTSMQRDIENGCQSELMQQIGSTVRLANKATIAVPISESIYSTLLPCEFKAQGKLNY